MACHCDRRLMTSVGQDMCNTRQHNLETWPQGPALRQYNAMSKAFCVIHIYNNNNKNNNNNHNHNNDNNIHNNNNNNNNNTNNKNNNNNNNTNTAISDAFFVS